MILDEETMLFLEEHIPELASSAVKQAYWHALASGYNVLTVEDNAIVEVHPDGTKRIIKTLQPAIPMIKGLKLEIR